MGAQRLVGGSVQHSHLQRISGHARFGTLGDELADFEAPLPRGGSALHYDRRLQHSERGAHETPHPLPFV